MATATSLGHTSEQHRQYHTYQDLTACCFHQCCPCLQDIQGHLQELGVHTPVCASPYTSPHHTPGLHTAITVPFGPSPHMQADDLAQEVGSLMAGLVLVPSLTFCVICHQVQAGVAINADGPCSSCIKRDGLSAHVPHGAAVFTAMVMHIGFWQIMAACSARRTALVSLPIRTFLLPLQNMRAQPTRLHFSPVKGVINPGQDCTSAKMDQQKVERESLFERT